MALLKDSLPDERDRHIPGRPGGNGSTLTLEDGAELSVAEQEDGGALVTFGEEQKPRAQGSFLANLAEGMEEAELQTLAQDLLRKIENDKLARQKRDQQYEEGLRRTGLGEDAPGGANFTGASKVTHPMLLEACVDFHAAAMKELFPPSGPVKTEIFGDKTPEQLKLAERQYRYMNWQFTEQIEEYREELSVTLTQTPMAGSQYIKFWRDDELGRPTCEFVPIDDLLLPYGVNSFWATHRYTHVMRLSESMFEERVESGMYLDSDAVGSPPASLPETTRAGAASERVEGVTPPLENLDGLRIVYEVSCFCKLKVDEDKRLPYLVSIDEHSGRIIAIYRNWEEDDKLKKKLHWIVDFNFIPWRGAQKMGFAQMLAGLSAAATGALRALLDSALVQTIPVLAKLKGAKLGSQAKSVDPLTITEVEAGTAVDDIRKVMMAMPFNPPSPVLYALLGWLSDAAKGVVTTSEEKIADAGNQMPVGTALALMESGAKVFSTIHAGLHHSQKKCLAIVARLNKDGVDIKAQIEKFGQVIATEQDFRQPLGVVPVSDPNIFSEAQRYAQMQLVTSFALGVDPKTGQPTATARLHNMHAVLHRFYELAKIPNIDELLPPERKPTEANAAAENTSVVMGNPIMAFPEQDHLSHLETHMRFILDPAFGSNPIALPTAYPGMVEHLKQHVSFLYAQTMEKIASAALGAPVSEMMKDKKNWPKVDKVLAAASPVVHENLTEIIGPLLPMINQLSQKVEEMKPPPPMDPSQAAVSVAKMEDARKREELGLKKQGEDRKLGHIEQKDSKAAEQKDRELEIKAVDVTAKHEIAREKLDLEADREGHTQARDIVDSLREDQRDAREDRRDSHQQDMDRRGADRDDESLRHTKGMGERDQRLKEATAADESARAGVEQRMAQGGMAHDQAMDLAEHDRNLRTDDHQRRMDEHQMELGTADHLEGARQHDDSVREQRADRKADGERAAADRKARAAEKSDKKPGSAKSPKKRK